MNLPPTHEPISACLIQVLGLSDLRSQPSEGDLGPATRCALALKDAGVSYDRILLISDFPPGQNRPGFHTAAQIADRLRSDVGERATVQMYQFDSFGNRFGPTWSAIDDTVSEVTLLAPQAHVHFQINGGQATATMAMILSGCSRLPENRRTFWSVHPESGLERVLIPRSLPICYYPS